MYGPGDLPATNWRAGFASPPANPTHPAIAANSASRADRADRATDRCGTRNDTCFFGESARPSAMRQYRSAV